MKTPKPIKVGNVWFGTIGPVETVSERITVQFAYCVAPDSKPTARDGRYVLVDKECWLHRAEPCELSDWKPEFAICCDSPPIRTDFYPDKQEAVFEMSYKLMDYSRQQHESSQH